GVGQRVAQLAALVDRPRGLGGDVGGDAAGEGELAEQSAQALGVLGDVGVDLRVGALEVGVGHQPRAAVAGSGDVHGRLFAFLDHPVGVGVDEVEPGGGAPVAQQPWLDVLGSESVA